MNNPLIFCIVNLNTKELTTITIKSILHFHPLAKIFVVDTGDGDIFSSNDEIVSKNTEVLLGISQKNTHLPIINIDCAENLTDEQKYIVKAKLGSNPYKILFRGSYNHQENIQFAINTIGEGFVLVDSDAPIIKPIDFADEENITVCDFMYTNAAKRGIQLLTPIFERCVPFIQYLNVSMMNQYDVHYYDPHKLVNLLDIALVQDKSLWFDTGCILAKQLHEKKLQWTKINHMEYIDHLGSASWGKVDVEPFIKKWKTRLGIK